VLFNDHKLDRMRARWRALVDGLRGDLGRKDYAFLRADDVDAALRLPSPASGASSPRR
jgi:hypothetical protein